MGNVMMNDGIVILNNSDTQAENNVGTLLDKQQNLAQKFADHFSQEIIREHDFVKLKQAFRSIIRGIEFVDDQMILNIPRNDLEDIMRSVDKYM